MVDMRFSNVAGRLPHLSWALTKPVTLFSCGQKKVSLFPCSLNTRQLNDCEVAKAFWCLPMISLSSESSGLIQLLTCRGPFLCICIKDVSDNILHLGLYIRTCTTNAHWFSIMFFAFRKGMLSKMLYHSVANLFRLLNEISTDHQSKSVCPPCGVCYCTVL